MYLGRIVELGSAAEIFANLRPPYTKLLDAIPDLDMVGRPRTPVGGDVPSPINPPSGARSTRAARSPTTDTSPKSQRASA